MKSCFENRTLWTAALCGKQWHMASHAPDRCEHLRWRVSRGSALNAAWQHCTASYALQHSLTYRRLTSTIVDVPHR